MLIYCNYSGLMEETQPLPLGMSSLMRGQMSLELSLLRGEGSLEPRSHQVGWVARERFLGKVAFDSGFKSRKSSGWVEWGEGFPERAWLWELQHQGVRLKESQHLGDRMAVSGVLCYWGGRTEGKGKKGEGSSGSSREKRSGFHRQRLGSRFSLSLTPHGTREAAGPPKSVRQGHQSGLPTQQPCDLRQVTQLSKPVSYQMGKITVTT